MYKLTHPAVSQIQCWAALLAPSVRQKEMTLNRFCERIDSIAELIAQVPEDEGNPYYYESGMDASFKFKGDAFETLCEMIFRFYNDDRIGVQGYVVASGEGDTGVDGYGVDCQGLPVTVQCKYRSLVRKQPYTPKELDSIRDHLDNFYCTSIFHHFVTMPGWHDMTKEEQEKLIQGRMLVITTADALHWRTALNVFEGRVRCIARDSSFGCMPGAPEQTIEKLFGLKTLLNGNKVKFWNTMRTLVS